MSDRTLPAAAVPVGAVVRIESAPIRTTTVTIERIHNSDPVGGRIRWETRESDDVRIGAATPVEIVSLP